MKRLPNNFGSISKLSGNRRRPYMIRTSGGKVLGYTRTKKEALLKLTEYNQKPYDVDLKNATLEDVWNLFVSTKSKLYSKGTIDNFKCRYNLYLTPLKNERYASLKTYQFEEYLNNIDASGLTKNQLITILKHLDDVAFQYEIIDKKYAYEITGYKTEKKKPRRPFTISEISLLWEHQGEEFVDYALILIYTGMRAKEFLSVTTDNIDGDFIVTGSKTEAGKNRRIPIHPKIKPIVNKLLKEDGCLCPLPYYTFARRFKDQMIRLKLDHIPHECRHTLRTLLDNAGGNKVCIDRIMGHKSGDTGKDVYTHKTDEQLMETIMLIN